MSHRRTICSWAIKLSQYPPRQVAFPREQRASRDSTEAPEKQDDHASPRAIFYPPPRSCPATDGSSTKAKVHILLSPILSPGRGGTSKPSSSHPFSPGMLYLARNQPSGAVSEHTPLPAAPCFYVQAFPDER